ncbi:MAG TPA: FAD-dependent oxidoreductase, partial [Gemmatimonadales bacterium]|nr:FAD-dependent oxidoreductase [Gemmatimonadales bacterium]
MELNSKIPTGPIEQLWDRHRFALKLVNPANKRKYSVIVVGSGLAGASAAASLSELGYNVSCFCFQDSPRRAHSIAAQGGINAAKNYQNDGDSVYRLFYDTVKGGDFRAREANVYRLAQISVNIIDQCVAQGVPFAREYAGQLANRSFGGAQVSRTFYARGQTGQQLLLGAYQSLMRQVHDQSVANGVPFAREYGGLLANRSFGGAQVSRTFYARGQTGQQLLIGAYQALEKQVKAGGVKMHTRHEMLELVLVEGKARGIITRDMVTGEIESHVGDAVILATGGYGNVF